MLKVALSGAKLLHGRLMGHGVTESLGGDRVLFASSRGLTEGSTRLAGLLGLPLADSAVLPSHFSLFFLFGFLWDEDGDLARQNSVKLVSIVPKAEN